MIRVVDFPTLVRLLRNDKILSEFSMQDGLHDVTIEQIFDRNFQENYDIDAEDILQGHYVVTPITLNFKQVYDKYIQNRDTIFKVYDTYGNYVGMRDFETILTSGCRCMDLTMSQILNGCEYIIKGDE